LALHGRVGVDVEERNMQQNLDGEIQSVFTPNERADLAAAHGPQKIHLFFRLWKMKEGLLKALGTGFSLDMSGIEIPKTLRQGMSAGEFCFPQLPAVRWWLESLDDPDFAAALAHELNPG
ncbi:MAG: 4'-phosphopantetheinyl transferase superfamily protein, partial [Proteobacteria bacterium]|nr:4'-phosphopantetheinyl transferase superfamily protein [Pseudomonadota bacterium]